jgi:hypothetical protein
MPTPTLTPTRTPTLAPGQEPDREPYYQPERLCPAQKQEGGWRARPRG